MPVLYKALSSASAFPGGRGRTGAEGPLPAGQMGLHRVLLVLLVLRSLVLAQITVPLPANATGDADTVSYILGIEGRPYTIHLRQHLCSCRDRAPLQARPKARRRCVRVRHAAECAGVAEVWRRVWGMFVPVSSDASGFCICQCNSAGCRTWNKRKKLWGGCHYRGYIDGFPNSAVTLSTCSGLRGLLQFENVSYGIEPLGYSPAFEHFVYRVSDEKTAGSLFANSHPEGGPGGLTAEEVSTKAHGDDEYNYMGSDTKAATQKIIQVFNLVNNMFNPLNVTIVLSSLELWTEENKISTLGEADDLLQRFLRWKQSYLALRSYDIAYLLAYRDRAAFVGATALGKACQRDAAGAVAVYQGAVTVESFSVLLAQLLGRSLGMGYDDSRECRCPGRVCLMSREALHFSGVKAFSSCSIGDFEAFLKHDGGTCLFHRPRLTGLSYRRAAFCGNGVVEPGEQCDCGGAEACLKDKCCTKRCRFKPGVKCSSGLCCNQCQFKQKNSQCRPAADAQCDLAEFCNGSSASCPPDLYVQDGHGCEHGTGYCYKGRCQSPDLQCQRLYGKGTKCGSGKVCNNKRRCHCHPGWKPPDCLQKGSRLGGSVDSGLQRALEDMTLVWPVLGSCLVLLLLAGAACLVLLLQWRVLGRRCGRQPPSTEG
ncbi:disintegrin and metalloproteinase domain-containing protein 2-like [Morus bassanus]